MAYPLTSALIETKLTAISALPHCTLVASTHPSREGKTIHYLRIADGTGADRPSILLIGGVHAREIAPPDALLSFAEALLVAYRDGKPLRRPSWDDPAYAPALHYPAFLAMSKPDVRAVLRRLNVIVAPNVNPDGRDFTLGGPALPAPPVPPEVQAEHDLHFWWRKNRRTPPAALATLTAPLSVGVPATSISVTPTTRGSLVADAPLELVDGGTKQVAVASAAFAAGDVAIPIYSFTPAVDYAAGSAVNDCMDYGVDINRNFDIAWAFDSYYDAAGVTFNTTFPNDSFSRLTNHDTYIGDAATSEPETQDIVAMMSDENIRYFVDVHGYGRDVLRPWAFNEDQSLDPTMSWHNTALDRPAGPGRARRGGAYSEWFPNDPGARPRLLFDKHNAVAARMAFNIKHSAGADPMTIARSTYATPTSIGYDATGCSDDFSLSTMFPPLGGPWPAPITNPEQFAFTIEVGSSPTALVDPNDDEGGFHVYPSKYPKVEREIWAAVSAFLTKLASWAGP
jgi:hypothetical protein